MSNVSAWSTSAASNNSAAPDGAPEGMTAASVNDTMREMMAAVARWYSDTDATLETAGTGNAYTLTTNSSHAALASQSILVFRADRANTGAATLNVDGLGAKSLRAGGAALSSGQLVADVVYIAAYNATGDAYDVIGALNNSATNLTTGTLPDARLSSNVPLKDAPGSFSAAPVLTATDEVLILEGTATTNVSYTAVYTSGLTVRMGYYGWSDGSHFTVENELAGGGFRFITNEGTMTVDGNVVATTDTTVNLTGNQTVAGVKTFSSRPQTSSAGGFLSHASGTNTGGSVTLSTSAASGTPAAGDVWIQHEA